MVETSAVERHNSNLRTTEQSEQAAHYGETIRRHAPRRGSPTQYREKLWRLTLRVTMSTDFAFDSPSLAFLSGSGRPQHGLHLTPWYRCTREPCGRARPNRLVERPPRHGDNAREDVAVAVVDLQGAVRYLGDDHLRLPHDPLAPPSPLGISPLQTVSGPRCSGPYPPDVPPTTSGALTVSRGAAGHGAPLEPVGQRVITVAGASP